MAKPEGWRRDLAAYPFKTDVPTRWADLDMLGHINNVSMAGLFEEGRGRFNRSLDLHRGGPGVRWLIAAVDLAYLAEAHHPHDVTVASGIGQIGDRSWTILSGAFQKGVCVATCDTTLVYTDACGACAYPAAFREKFEAARVVSP
ncbi:MAG: acyl-CoA thioesterase [Sphingomonadaceae bacterium]|nr:acyl-CoA thioesterase [Sphingomonadaceae bacterium]